MPAEDDNTITLLSTVGFNGSVPGGLIKHPHEDMFIYPLGNTVVGKSLKNNQQFFLTGHTNNVSCITASKCGKLLASGQLTHMGFKAPVIVWDYSSKTEICRLSLHKVAVQSVAFSPSGKYLATLGGSDDGTVVIWDMDTKTALCGAKAAVERAGMTYCIDYSHHCDFTFTTGGDKTLRVWKLDVENTKLRPQDVNMGQIQRVVKCCKYSADDSKIFCGTTTGDILQINADTKILAAYGPENKKPGQKNLFSLGVQAVHVVDDTKLIVGAGDGTVAEVTVPGFKKGKSKKLDDCVTSLVVNNKCLSKMFAGTKCSQIYEIGCDKQQFTCDVTETCHYGEIFDIAFAQGTAQLLATAAKDEIRVWDNYTGKELLRIRNPNITCRGIEITQDGKNIISGWDDNKIRVYSPKTGTLKFDLENAHKKGVTALAVTSDNMNIISGGGEGNIRIWQIRKGSEHHDMKEHKSEVTCIRIKSNNLECVSASTDGSCIVWDLASKKRMNTVQANTMFKAVCYSFDESQIITTGTDRKIAYWEVVDATEIRSLDGSQTNAITAMDISPDGNTFVTGGEDQLVKVWNYNGGVVTHMAAGHCDRITCIKISPDQRYIVSVSADGAILRWEFPLSFDEYSEGENE